MVATTRLGFKDDVTTNLHSFNCVADFMGTGQDAVGNVNGGISFILVHSGGKIYAKDAYAGLGRSIEGIGRYVGYGRVFPCYAGYGTGTLADDMNFYTWLLSTSTRMLSRMHVRTITRP